MSNMNEKPMTPVEIEREKDLNTLIARVWREVYGSPRFDKQSIEYEFAKKLLESASAATMDAVPEVK